MLTWWQWGLLGLVPPAIIALYFLKLRRQPLEVPSTYLWSRAIEDLHVNSLWQRLRQSILLLLQLLVVLLIAFALLRPGWSGTELEDDRIVLLVDTSASMAATDTSPSRLDTAKRDALDLIERMRPRTAAMVISFSDVAKVEQAFTDNRRLLRSRIEQIEQTNRPSDLGEALRAAAGLANPGQTGDPNNPLDIKTAEAQPATLYILTDGGFATVPDFKLGNLAPEYLKQAGEEQANVAIVAFSTEVNPEKPGRVQAFGRLENHADDEATVQASLSLGDTLLDAKSVSLPPRDAKTGLPGSTGVSFEMQEVETGVLKLTIDSKDQLLADNTAYAVVNMPRQAKVLVVTPGSDALVLALKTEEVQKIANVTLVDPGFLETKAYQDQAAEGAFDVIIYDSCAPKTMPDSSTLFIGGLPPAPSQPPATAITGEAPAATDAWQPQKEVEQPIVIDVNQVHPLTQLVQMSNVRILYATPLKGPPGTVNLIDTDVGSIYAIGPRGGFEDAVLGFGLTHRAADGSSEFNTDWPRRRSFPVFIMNALKYLGGVRTSLAAPSVVPGAPIVLRTATPVANVIVSSPRGDRFEVPRDASSNYIFTRTEELGVYEVREGTGTKVTQQFAVNLFDTRESDLRPAEKLEIGHEEVQAQQAKRTTRREFWKWLLVGAIGVLIFEWYIYNRRVYL